MERNRQEERLYAGRLTMGQLSKWGIIRLVARLGQRGEVYRAIAIAKKYDFCFTRADMARVMRCEFDSLSY